MAGPVLLDIKITKYLNFTIIGDTGKTLKIGVGNNAGVKLGIIKWVGGWHRYCFFPMEDMQFDAGCLVDIVDYINELMAARKS